MYTECLYVCQTLVARLCMEIACAAKQLHMLAGHTSMLEQESYYFAATMQMHACQMPLCPQHLNIVSATVVHSLIDTSQLLHVHKSLLLGYRCCFLHSCMMRNDS